MIHSNKSFRRERADKRCTHYPWQRSRKTVLSKEEEERREVEQDEEKEEDEREEVEAEQEAGREAAHRYKLG